jgi:hypothetical protein
MKLNGKFLAVKYERYFRHLADAMQKLVKMCGRRERWQPE